MVFLEPQAADLCVSSCSLFMCLNEALRSGLCSRSWGFILSLAGKDVIGLAETGSGKTGAFALPILQSLLASPQRLHTLVLTPTRELAFQISEQFEALGSSIGVKCGRDGSGRRVSFIFHAVFLINVISAAAVVVGGIDMMSQSLVLAKKPHIVIGKIIKGEFLLLCLFLWFTLSSSHQTLFLIYKNM